MKTGMVITGSGSAKSKAVLTNDDLSQIVDFFLNHRTLIESRVPERVGKTPTELMTGETHLHWLELLGFELFQRVSKASF